MWSVGKFVFFFSIAVQQIRGQFVPTLLEPHAYITKVVDSLWIKIKEHGISNLPVLDASVIYNTTNLGVDLIGPVSFEDGFVQDIDLVSLSPQNFLSSASIQQATVSGRILFTNLRIHRDFRADFTTGMKVGTVVFTPVLFSYQLNIVKQHDNDTVDPRLTFFSYNNVVWDADPDNLVTRLMRRQFATANQQSQSGAQLMWTTAEEWIPLFTEFLREIIEPLGFPELHF